MNRFVALVVAACLLYAPRTLAETIIGTAVFLNQHGDMLTNRHVVDGCKRISIKTKEDRIFPASVIAVSSQFDMAAIREVGYTPQRNVWFPTTKDRYVYIPTSGMTLLYGGFDNDHDKNIENMIVNISNGRAAEFLGLGDSGGIYVSTMVSNAHQGASGSGVFDYSGSLFGLVFSGYVDGAARKNKADPYYGRNIVNFYNNNAILQFLNNETRIQTSAIVDPPTVPRFMSVELIYMVTSLVICDK